MRARIAAIVLSIALAGAALADRETAQFAAGRADKALQAKKWDEAEGLYRKALEEDETFLPARYGLAQALVGAGKSTPAVDELRKLMDAARDEASPLPAEWKPIVVKAEKQLADLDAAGTALQKIQNGFADTLVDFAQRWITKDPASAERALRKSVKLKPGNAKALQLLEKLGGAGAASSTPAKEVVQLFDGTTLTGWTAANAPQWTVNEGEIIGVIREGAYAMWSSRTFEGDFTVRCEARLKEEYAQPAYFGFMPCMKGKRDTYSYGVLRGKLDWDDDTGSNDTRSIMSKLPSDLKKPFDPKEWNTYEMRCFGKTAVALVNGEEIGREERPERRSGGSIGLKMQNVEVRFRKIEVEVR